MKKTYVLDTNVLIQAPYALESFENNHIVLPLAVLEELDGLKHADGERGNNARQAIRFLEKLRLSGNLTQGVALPNGGTLRLEVNHIDVALPHGMDPTSRDNRILKVCKGLMEEHTPVVLVTRDIVARIKAQMMGVRAEDFTTEQVPARQHQYTGRTQLYLPNDEFSTFRKKGVSAEKLYTVNDQGEPQKAQLTENQFVILQSDTAEKKTLLGRYREGSVVPLSFSSAHPFGVTPRSVGQQFLQEALMLGVEEAPLVIVKGPAGTAKTFYALAVGLEKVLEQQEKTFRKILVCRSNAQFDQDIGFLPGTEQEKISPLLRPVVDNLEILLDQGGSKKERSSEKELHSRIDYLFSSGTITAEAMNFMRGRSITNTWLIIDEAQNLTPRQVKGIITRVGQGTKVILLGDPAQIDHPLLDERTNGLSYAAERMKGSPLCFQLTLQPDECERSDLALDAALRM
jgi:PhoH-like ATPase